VDKCDRKHPLMDTQQKKNYVSDISTFDDKKTKMSVDFSKYDFP